MNTTNNNNNNNNKNKDKNINITTNELLDKVDILRQQHGLTWKDLCNIAGLNKNTITLARKRNDIKYVTLCWLANSMGYGVQTTLVSAKKILGGTTTEDSDNE